MFPLLPFPTPREVIIFALVLSRVAGIFSAIPVFSGRALPARIKIIVVLMITLCCYPALHIIPPATIEYDAISLGLLIFREILIGLTLGFITRIIFSAVEFSGQIIGMQMGLTISSIIDPSFGNQTQIMSVMQSLLATLLFLSLNIHHLFISSLVDSFRILPLGSWRISDEIVSFLIKGTADIMILGVRIAAPVMVALLLSSVVLGIMARAFPQMNIFMVSMPLNIGLGLIVLGLTVTIFFNVLQVAFGNIKIQTDILFRLMAKGG